MPIRIHPTLSISLRSRSLCLLNLSKAVRNLLEGISLLFFEDNVKIEVFNLFTFNDFLTFNSHRTIKAFIGTVSHGVIFHFPCNGSSILTSIINDKGNKMIPFVTFFKESVGVSTAKESGHIIMRMNKSHLAVQQFGLLSHIPNYIGRHIELSVSGTSDIHREDIYTTNL